MCWPQAWSVRFFSRPCGVVIQVTNARFFDAKNDTYLEDQTISIRGFEALPDEAGLLSPQDTPPFLQAYLVKMKGIVRGLEQKRTAIKQKEAFMGCLNDITSVYRTHLSNPHANLLNNNGEVVRPLYTVYHDSKAPEKGYACFPYIDFVYTLQQYIDTYFKTLDPSELKEQKYYGILNNPKDDKNLAWFYRDNHFHVAPLNKEVQFDDIRCPMWMPHPEVKVTFIQTSDGELRETPGLLLTYCLTPQQDKSVKIAYFHGATGPQAFKIQSLQYGFFSDPKLDQNIKDTFYEKLEQGKKVKAQRRGENFVTKMFIPFASVNDIGQAWHEFFDEQGFNDLIETLPKADFVEPEDDPGFLETSLPEAGEQPPSANKASTPQSHKFSHKKTPHKKKKKGKKKTANQHTSTSKKPPSSQVHEEEEKDKGGKASEDKASGEESIPPSLPQNSASGSADISPLEVDAATHTSEPQPAERMDAMPAPSPKGAGETLQPSRPPSQPATLPTRPSSTLPVNNMSDAEFKRIKWRDVGKLINPLIRSMSPPPKVAITGSHYQFSYEGMQRLTMAKPHGSKKVDPKGMKALYHWFFCILQQQAKDCLGQDESKVGNAS